MSSMVLPIYIKQKSQLHEHLPWLAGPAFTIYPYIYLPKTTYLNLISEKPSVANLATLAHEQVHYKRQQDIGIAKYAMLYLFSKKFRYQEELLAIAPQMSIYTQGGLIFDVNDRARRLSGSEYLWCVSFDEAVKDLSALHKNASI